MGTIANSYETHFSVLQSNDEGNKNMLTKDERIKIATNDRDNVILCDQKIPRQIARWLLFTKEGTLEGVCEDLWCVPRRALRSSPRQSRLPGTAPAAPAPRGLGHRRASPPPHGILRGSAASATTPRPRPPHRPASRPRHRPLHPPPRGRGADGARPRAPGLPAWHEIRPAPTPATVASHEPRPPPT